MNLIDGRIDQRDFFHMTDDNGTAAQDSFPYAYAPRHLDAAVDEIRRGPLPTVLDPGFFTRAGLTSNAQPGVRRCFHAFGFTDETDTFTPRGQGLRSTGPEAQKVALEALEACYPYLWPRLAKGEMKPEELDNYISGHMDLAESARSSARRTLLWLVHQSGNEDVAKSLEHGGGQSSGQSTAKPRKRKARPSPQTNSPSDVPVEHSGGGAPDSHSPQGASVVPQPHMDRFGVLAQVLTVEIDSSSSPDLVREVRELLVTLFGSADGGERNADT